MTGNLVCKRLGRIETRRRWFVWPTKQTNCVGLMIANGFAGLIADELKILSGLIIYSLFWWKSGEQQRLNFSRFSRLIVNGRSNSPTFQGEICYNLGVGKGYEINWGILMVYFLGPIKIWAPTRPLAIFSKKSR